MTHGKCVFHGPNGTYNLQPLQRTDNKPRFQTPGRWHFEYFYNPCTSFLMTDEEEDAGCTFNVAVCEGGQGGGPYVKIGDQSSAECTTDPETGRQQLTYTTHNYPGRENAAIIRLICDWERKIPKFQKTIVKGHPWVFSLTHRCACANGCPEDPVTTRATTVATRTTTMTTTGLRTITGTTNRTTAVFPFTQELFWTPLVVSFVAIAGLIVFIASLQLIRIAVRRCKHHRPNNDRNNDRGNDPRQKLLPNGSNDGKGFKNVGDSPLAGNVLPRNPSCNITVSKKNDFNSGKFITEPI